MKKYSIIYEDELLLLVNKPQGLPVTPGNIENSLIELIFQDFPSLEKVCGYKSSEGGLLNRLDNETGGIVFIAKNDLGFEYYSSLMKRGFVKKTYNFICDGIPKNDFFIIDYPIFHHPKNNKKMVAYKEGMKYSGKLQYCQTSCKLLMKNNGLSLMEATIVKGIRHQIRVHASGFGLPIVGDKIYNKKNYKNVPNHLLFANKVVFETPEKKKTAIEIEVPFLDFLL